jgi:peptidoglycan/LPS O-acetylase OafA/YrhL
MTRNEREHHWDFARAFYLLLGIPFHAAVVYSTHHDWSVASPERSPVLTFVADMIHTFRMPGFFLIAGYFSMMILARKGPGPWLGTRVVRLGVPLVTATLVILPFQMLVQSWAEMVGQGLGYPNFYGAAMSRLTHFDEPWISHLWFLYSLIAFSTGLALLAAIVKLDRFERWTKALASAALRYWWVTLALIALAVIAWAFMLPAVYQIGGERTGALLGYIQYFPFYLVGVAAFLSIELRESHANADALALAIGVAAAVLSMQVSDSPLEHAALMMGGLAAAWLITGYVQAFARRHFAHPRGAVRKVADASFSIYLFHHPIIFVMAAFFAGVDWPPVLEFAVMVPVAAVLSYGIHVIIVSNRVTAFLFNGVWPRGKRDKAVVAAPLAGDVSPRETQPGTAA